MTNARPTLRPGAGTRFSVDEGDRFVFDFSTHDDRSVEGNGLTYRITGGADAHLFEIDAKTGKLYFSEAPDFENPLDRGRNNGYQIRIRVTDAQGAFDDDGFSIHVRDVREARNRRPTLVPGAGARFQVDENTTHVFDFVTHDDNSSEGNGLTYSITGGADAHLFNIDETTGKLRFNNAPDFENPRDHGRDNGYQVRVRVTDAQGAFDDDGYTVHVNNVREASNRRPTLVPGAGAKFQVDENTTHVFDFVTRDDNSSEGDGLTYSITGGADAALFDIDPVTGKLRFVNAPDFENPLDHGGDNGYHVRVRVTDAQGAFDDDGYSIHVNDVAEADPIDPGKTIGGPGDDFLGGTDGDDDLCGFAGSDVLNGGIGNDTLDGVDPYTNRGTGEIDLLVGGLGKDTFVLGDAQSSYYLDPGKTDFGFTSFAIVDDFDLGTDYVVLSGSEDYIVSSDDTGTFLLAGSFADGSADAIAKFDGVQLTEADLAGDSFTFV